MKLRGRCVKISLLSLFLLLFISSNREYVLQICRHLASVSRHLASTRTYIWYDNTRFFYRTSDVNFKVYQKRKDAAYKVSTRKSEMSTQKWSKRHGVSNTVQLIKHEPLADVWAEKENSSIKSQNKARAASYRQVDIPVTILKQNIDLCKSPGLQWIIYVHSAAPHFGNRYTIRQTWGNKNLFKDHRTAVVFLIGKVKDPEVQQKLEEEFKQFSDLVQGDFMDTYRNMTQKAVLGLQYISAHCSHVPYAIKADDDVVIDIFKVMDMVKTYKHHDFVMCYRWHNMLILRTHKKSYQTTRWGIPDYLFPGKIVYPDYCAGLGYIITTNLVGEMYKHIKSIPYIHVDDVCWATNVSWQYLLRTQTTLRA